MKRARAARGIQIDREVEELNNRLSRIAQTLNDKTACHNIRVGFATGLTKDDDAELYEDLLAKIQAAIIIKRNDLLKEFDNL